jgi:hypothetical protein
MANDNWDIDYFSLLFVRPIRLWDMHAHDLWKANYVYLRGRASTCPFLSIKILLSLIPNIIN